MVEALKPAGWIRYMIRMPNKRKGSFFVALFFSCLAISATAVQSGQFVSYAVLTEAVDEENRAILPAAKFKRNTLKIICAFELLESSKGKKMEAVWIAEDVGGVAPPNFVIDVWSLDLPSSSVWTFEPATTELSKPTNGWPVGQYRLELRFDDDIDLTLPFTIE